nr:hypothetical protein [uncultured Flavobacterium sp.]
MENKLEIKYRNQKQSFEILEDSLFVHLNTLKHQLEYKIPFEEIKNDIYTIRNKGDKKDAFLYFSIFINIVLLFFIFFENYKIDLIYVYSGIFPLTLILSFALNDINKGFEEKHIESSKILYFICSKKNKIEIDIFIKTLFEKRNAYFKNKYFLIDPILPYNAQYERYIWLYTNKYIDENEFEIIKEDLDKYFNFNPNSIV